MKKIFSIILFLLIILAVPVVGQSCHTDQKEVNELYNKVDSLERLVNMLIYDCQKNADSQTAIANRLIEMRDDYVVLLTDSHETRNWLLGIVTLIVGAFGVAFPFFSNRNALKKSEKVERIILQLYQNFEDIKKKLFASEKRIKDIATQVNKDRSVVQGQLDGIKNIKNQVGLIQTKIETSERNARESQKETMINRLFAQAFNEKNSNIAIDLYTRILKIEENASAYIFRANQYLKSKLYREAILDAEKVIDLNNSDKKTIAIAYCIIATAKANLKIYDEALQYVNKGVEIFPNYSEMYKIRATIYARQDRLQDAIDDLYKIASFRRLNANDYNELAYSHYKLGKYDIALSNVTESLKLNPNFAEALDTRGCIYMELGEQYYESALMDFGQALKLNPRLWETYENRMHLYDKMILSEVDDKKITMFKQMRDRDMEIFANHEIPLREEKNNDNPK